MIYHLVAKFSGPTALGAYTIKALLKSDPIYAALRGYFHQLNEDDAKRVSQRLWQLYLPHFYLLNMHRDRIIGEWSQERRRSYKMDHHLFFLAVMYFLRIAERAGDREDLIDNSLTSDQFMGMAERFLGQRFEYLEYAVVGVL
ncbi:hypothetical protein HED51_24490 [Ochrobactrum grignonense]|nr:hypothetical protein [Brucella grignonensis]